MIRIFQVDAFAGEAFSGNPAAVCLLDRAVDGAADAKWMQSVASEMNLSETAFVSLRGGGGYDLRWFTPICEVDLCGHATLASAHILWEEGLVAETDEIEFHTLSGVLRAVREAGIVVMDFPADRATGMVQPPGLLEALGLTEGAIGVFKGSSDILVEVERAETVLDLSPDFKALAGFKTRGVIVAAMAGGMELPVEGDFDFVSRFFAPAFGIDEDPVTGSAHVLLGPFFGERLMKNELMAYQASRRGGVVLMRLVSGSERILIGGEAVTVLRGEIVS